MVFVIFDADERRLIMIYYDRNDHPEPLVSDSETSASEVCELSSCKEVATTTRDIIKATFTSIRCIFRVEKRMEEK